MHSKLFEEKNLREVAESFYIFLRTPDKLKACVEIMQSIFSDNYIHRYNIEILILFDPELQLISTKTMIKKIKELLTDL